MKTLLLLTALLTSVSALADQTIQCEQINKDGSRAIRGGRLEIRLGEQASSVRMQGFWKPGSNFGRSFTSISSAESQDESENTWTQISFLDEANDLVEYQLQFDRAGILGENFSGVEAALVVGLDLPSTETETSWAYSLLCRTLNSI